MPNNVRLSAAVAFGDGEVTLWTRVQASRLIAETAGALPQAVPTLPPPHLEAAGNGHAAD